MSVRRALEIVRLYRRYRQSQADIALLEASPLFDKAYYLSRNPDVAASGLNPAAHYLAHGVAENRNPSEEFDNRDYLGRYPDVASSGMNPLLHYLRVGAKEGLQWRAGSQHATADGHAVNSLRAGRFTGLRPLSVYAAPPESRRRVTLLTDSINHGSLFGGVGTSLIFTALLAERLGASLRIVTQIEAAEVSNVAAVLRGNAIPFHENIEFAFTDRKSDEDREIDLRAGDLFVTTSWWTTSNALASLAAEQIIYFLQDDERMFYAHGDEYLRCSELLRHPGLRVAVNSQILYTHLAAEGFASIAQQNLWFEPAFPAALSVTDTAKAPGDKRLFFFDARPDTGRNLFIRGMEAISSALEQGVLDPQSWDFCFVGEDLEAMVLPGGVTPQLLQSLPWPDYVALLRRVDLGLSLMYTPHPGDKPLDLAAAGAVVVTNRYGPKTSLSQYSPNIFCVEPTVEGLVTALAEGAALAGDLPRRRANQARNQFVKSWQQTLAPVLDRLTADLY